MVGGNDGVRSREIKRPSNLIGDVTWCHGTVVSKDDAAGAVTLELRAVNQRDEVTATGEAVVGLPRRRGPT
jgi:acyl dehydratase